MMVGKRLRFETKHPTEFVDITDAHHMVAGDANDAFNEAVFTFLDKQVSTRQAG